MEDGNPTPRVVSPGRKRARGDQEGRKERKRSGRRRAICNSVSWRAFHARLQIRSTYFIPSVDFLVARESRKRDPGSSAARLLHDDRNDRRRAPSSRIRAKQRRRDKSNSALRISGELRTRAQSVRDDCYFDLIRFRAGDGRRTKERARERRGKPWGRARGSERVHLHAP